MSKCKIVHRYLLLACLIFATATTYAGEYWNVEDALIAQWKLNDYAVGTNVVEATGAHNGIASTDTWRMAWYFPKIGGSFAFWNNSYVTIPDHDDFSFGNGSNDIPFSMAAWLYVYTYPVTEQHILSKFNGMDQAEWQWWLSSDERVEFRLIGDINTWEGVTTSNPLSPGWHLVIVTYDGRGGSSASDGIKMWVDGIPAAASMNDMGVYTAMANTASDVIMGASKVSGVIDTTKGFKGSIDDMCIFNRVLSPIEIAGLYKYGNGTEELSTHIIQVQPGHSIQDAIDLQAMTGDWVYAGPGVYPENIVMKNGVDVVGEACDSVIINGRVLFRGVFSSLAATLRNVTVAFPEGNPLFYTNNYYANWNLQDDAGITVINATPTIENCVIAPDLDTINNAHPDQPELESYGKGIQIWNMYNNPDLLPTIENNIIRNTEYGVYCFSQAFGGAILGQIKNNTFYHNQNSIILRMHKEKPEIKNNIISGGDTGIFLTYRDDLLFDERKALMHHNDVWGMPNTYWLDAEALDFNLAGINGNISDDPLFLNPDNYDFSLALSSPCVGQADDGGDMGARLTAPTPPEIPTISSLSSPTNQRFITIGGTKGANTSILINGEQCVPVSSGTTWTVSSYDLGADGHKILMVTSKNAYGQESEAAIANIVLDTVSPMVEITSPANGAEFSTAPITVSGTINEPGYVVVNGVLATIDGNDFTAENVDLRYGENTITATAYDLADNSAADAISVTSTTTSDYNLTKITSDVYEDDPTNIVAGSQVSLTVKLEIDGSLAVDEPVEFHITQGNGSMVQTLVDTNANGEATGILNTDINAAVANLVEVFDQNFPNKKVVFHIDTKAGTPTNLIKVTDENIHPAPGAGIELIVKLVDANNNPVYSEQVSFQIISGGGNLSKPTATTNELGIAKVFLTTLSNPSYTSQIEAQLTSNPAISSIFIITTSELPQATIEEVLAKVEANDSLIQDVKADIHITSNAPWMAPDSQLKIWIKENKQKVQELSPNPGVYIRPIIEDTTSMTKEIISYNPTTNIYVIKIKKLGQITEHPYLVHYIDYNKGVIVKTEYHILQDSFKTTSISEYSDFIQISTAWGYQTQVDKIYGEDNQALYTTTNNYSNIQINTEIPDSEFEN